MLLNNMTSALTRGYNMMYGYQVCSYWRNVSASENLWEILCNCLWDSRERQIEISWRAKFVRFHATLSNFRQGKARYLTLQMEEDDDEDFSVIRRCTCLALSNEFLAAGFYDGAVRIFDTCTGSCICTLRHEQDYVFGLYSSAIAGLCLDNKEVVYASVRGSLLTGDIGTKKCTSVYSGNVIEDGALISFAGSKTWWVGLYAGSPGQSIRIWSSETRELLYRGGNLLDDDAMLGWRTFIELADHFGKVRIVNDTLLLAASRTKLTIIDLETHGTIVNVEWHQQITIGALDVACNRLLTVAMYEAAQILRIPALDELCKLEHVLAADDYTKLIGTMNSRHALLTSDPGFLNVWDALTGTHLYAFREQVKGIHDLVANDMFVAACSRDSTVHFWDFTAPRSPH
ncbi:hypothetical protein O6H91_21G008200 [Diphasiastrum complanatum]|uniref:Uncharacterized protein n=2 Tax=Diphasiastrum complanatum TaxID=34168 RepID=A0ACC2AIU8_DIPCM|nr:hypothetical protein O6H91_21G008200 [Diphasiastrum complanatum]